MEIDPRNPPTFVIDEGITLEVCGVPHVESQYLTSFVRLVMKKTGIFLTSSTSPTCRSNHPRRQAEHTSCKAVAMLSFKMKMGWSSKR